ncbi:transposase [Streptomyces luteolifulvus]|uniref:transposase n=1 Tax=Streptomyces luteolifulvus TaxID=2615112 RepID=UPI001CDA05FB|nr:transposase [Streptomyces luteolifulvus]
MPKPYPEEFRQDVVRVARNRGPGVTVEQVATDFGVHPMTLWKWMRRADIDDGTTPGVASQESAELREARRRIKLLEQENEVLRRAAAYLSQAHLPGKGFTQAARAEFERIAAAPGDVQSRPPTTEPNTFVREAEYWRIAFDGRHATVRDSKGMHHLARLLTAPDREFHVLDLVAADSDAPKATGRLLRVGTPVPSWTTAPSRYTVGGSPRSTTTSRKPGPTTTSRDSRRPNSNATS